MGEIAKSNADNLIEELRRRYDRLTPSQKRIAAYIITHQQRIAFLTADQLGRELDMAPSTIVRFSYQLGLNGYPEIRERMRELVLAELTRGHEANPRHLRDGFEGTSFGASLGRDRQILEETISNLDADKFERAVNVLARARHVHVLAGFSTLPVASYLARSLDRQGISVSLLPYPLEVRQIGPEDCLLAFSFPPDQITRCVALLAKENRPECIVLTGAAASELAVFGDLVFLVPFVGSRNQSSLVPAMAVANALQTGVSALKDPEDKLPILWRTEHDKRLP
jgi:DNA-binding MurR/RpiR family transcriptional regulator